ncbi:hypothetical protein PLICRDRAFT_170236 [Plicaturopsis crispa FD-325 SS-3]|nr:hypothetical protein PLICRDRAFT_170236 [Plicaturopsis crispa FD-325 SS-3]
MSFINRLQRQILRFTRIPFVEAKTVPGLDLSHAPKYYRKEPPWLGGPMTVSAVGASLLTGVFGATLVWHEITHWKTSSSPPTQAKPSSSNSASEEPGQEDASAGVSSRLVVTFCGATLGAEMLLAAAIIIGRSRVVRKIYVLPPVSSKQASSHMRKSPRDDKRRVFIQTVAHWGPFGRLFPLRDCTLVPHNADSDIDWECDLKVDGEVKDPQSACKALMSEWYPESGGRLDAATVATPIIRPYKPL